MELTWPVLLILAEGSAAGDWLPGTPAGWILPVAAFALGAGLARRRTRANGEHDAETAVERGVSLPRYRRSLAVLESELERSRRVNRSLAVLVLKLDPDSVAELERQLSTAGGALSGRTAVRCTVHAIFAVVGALLDEHLREIDVATTDPAGRRYVIVLPEATRVLAHQTARRLAALVADETGVRIRSGVSEFRTDGVLLEDLVHAATRACDGSVGQEGDTATHGQRALSRG